MTRAIDDALWSNYRAAIVAYCRDTSVNEGRAQLLTDDDVFALYIGDIDDDGAPPTLATHVYSVHGNVDDVRQDVSTLLKVLRRCSKALQDMTVDVDDDITKWRAFPVRYHQKRRRHHQKRRRHHRQKKRLGDGAKKPDEVSRGTTKRHTEIATSSDSGRISKKEQKRLDNGAKKSAQRRHDDSAKKTTKVSRSATKRHTAIDTTSSDSDKISKKEQKIEAEEQQRQLELIRLRQLELKQIDGDAVAQLEADDKIATDVASDAHRKQLEVMRLKQLELAQCRPRVALSRDAIAGMATKTKTKKKKQQRKVTSISADDGDTHMSSDADDEEAMSGDSISDDDDEVMNEDNSRERVKPSTVGWQTLLNICVLDIDRYALLVFGVVEQYIYIDGLTTVTIPYSAIVPTRPVVDAISPYHLLERQLRRNLDGEEATLNRLRAMMSDDDAVTARYEAESNTVGSVDRLSTALLRRQYAQAVYTTIEQNLFYGIDDDTVASTPPHIYRIVYIADNIYVVPTASSYVIYHCPDFRSRAERITIAASIVIYMLTIKRELKTLAEAMPFLPNINDKHLGVDCLTNLLKHAPTLQLAQDLWYGEDGFDARLRDVLMTISEHINASVVAQMNARMLRNYDENLDGSWLRANDDDDFTPPSSMVLARLVRVDKYRRCFMPMREYNLENENRLWVGRLLDNEIIRHTNVELNVDIANIVLHEHVVFVQALFQKPLPLPKALVSFQQIYADIGLMFVPTMLDDASLYRRISIDVVKTLSIAARGDTTTPAEIMCSIARVFGPATLREYASTSIVVENIEQWLNGKRDDATLTIVEMTTAILNIAFKLKLSGAAYPYVPALLLRDEDRRLFWIVYEKSLDTFIGVLGGDEKDDDETSLSLDVNKIKQVLTVNMPLIAEVMRDATFYNILAAIKVAPPVDDDMTTMIVEMVHARYGSQPPVYVRIYLSLTSVRARIPTDDAAFIVAFDYAARNRQIKIRVDAADVDTLNVDAELAIAGTSPSTSTSQPAFNMSRLLQHIREDESARLDLLVANDLAVTVAQIALPINTADAEEVVAVDVKPIEEEAIVTIGADLIQETVVDTVVAAIVDPIIVNDYEEETIEDGGDLEDVDDTAVSIATEIAIATRLEAEDAAAISIATEDVVIENVTVSIDPVTDEEDIVRIDNVIVEDVTPVSVTTHPIMKNAASGEDCVVVYDDVTVILAADPMRREDNGEDNVLVEDEAREEIVIVAADPIVEDVAGEEIVVGEDTVIIEDAAVSIGTDPMMVNENDGEGIVFIEDAIVTVVSDPTEDDDEDIDVDVVDEPSRELTKRDKRIAKMTSRGLQVIRKTKVMSTQFATALAKTNVTASQATAATKAIATQFATALAKTEATASQATEDIAKTQTLKSASKTKVSATQITPYIVKTKARSIQTLKEQTKQIGTQVAPLTIKTSTKNLQTLIAKTASKNVQTFVAKTATKRIQTLKETSDAGGTAKKKRDKNDDEPEQIQRIVTTVARDRPHTFDQLYIRDYDPNTKTQKITICEIENNSVNVPATAVVAHLYTDSPTQYRPLDEIMAVDLARPILRGILRAAYEQEPIEMIAYLTRNIAMANELFAPTVTQRSLKTEIVANVFIYAEFNVQATLTMLGTYYEHIYFNDLITEPFTIHSLWSYMNGVGAVDALTTAPDTGTKLLRRINTPCGTLIMRGISPVLMLEPYKPITAWLSYWRVQILQMLFNSIQWFIRTILCNVHIIYVRVYMWLRNYT